MRSIFLFLLLFVIVHCTAGDKLMGSGSRLNGTWVPVKQEMGGKPLPKVVYEHQQMVISDTNYTLTAESVDKGALKFNGNKMDIYGRDGVNAGKHFTALYNYAHDQLTICYNLAGTEYPDSFSTKGKPLYFLSVFEKTATK